MRITTARSIPTLTALALLVVLFALPTASWGAEALPDEMVDPVGAMEPEIEVGEPAAEPGPDAQGDAGTPTVAGVAPEAAAGDDAATAGAADVPVATAPVGGGSLPFTGPEPGLLTLLFLVGSLALCGGAVAFAHARAMAETA